MTTASVLLVAFLGLLLQNLGSAVLLEENCGIAPKMASNRVSNFPSDLEPRIKGGNNATLGSNPWMALLLTPGTEGQPPSFFCGGTLIHECFVLTAAHCPFNKTHIIVRLGEHDRSSQNMTGKEDIYVIQAYVFKEYINFSYKNDIALLRLSRCVSYNDYIQPICIQLDQRRNNAIRKFTAVGWGRTRNQETSNMLQTVTLERLPKSNCTAQFWNNETSTQICAGSTTGGADTCGGDSGGPLYTSMTKYAGVRRKTQLGIISFGTSQCVGVGVYTNVMSYVKWIEKIVMESDIEVVVPKINFLDANCIGNSIQFGDKKSQTSFYPWLAYIYMDSFPLALGTLISDRYVISTAHWYLTGTPLMVVLGWKGGSTGFTYTVEGVFSHLNFKEFNVNDIALLKLKYKVQYNDHLRPICMPFLNDTTSYRQKANKAEHLVVIGFSRGSSANIQGINSTNCYSGTYQKLGENILCFQHPQSTRLVSGSPLVRRFTHGNSEAYTLVGMASFGRSDQRGPDVYTDVLGYASLIMSFISQ